MNSQQDPDEAPYPSNRTILKYHGLLVWLLTWLSTITRITTPTGLWLLTGEALPHISRKAEAGKAHPVWQDIGVILHVALTALVSTSDQSWFTHALAWLLLLDIVSYHGRVLWFDDLRVNVKRKRFPVWSHRRILVQAIINFIETIFVFSTLYPVYWIDTSAPQDVLQASFRTAVSLGSDGLTGSPQWLVNLQVVVSLFFLAFVITISASVGYKRQELAP